MATLKKTAVARLSLPGKLIVGATLLALPLVAYYVIFHSEIQSEINAAQAAHSRVGQELSSAKQAEHAYQEDLQELSERERNRRELMKILPETTEYPAFLSSVQNVANLVGVELIAWTPQEEVPEEFYARVPMKLELRGRFHQLAKFFYNVGQSERIINMENIALTTPQQKDGEVILTAEVLATAFHALSESEGGDSEPANQRRPRR